MLVVTYDLSKKRRYLEDHPFVIKDYSLKEIRQKRIFTFGAQLTNPDPYVRGVADMLHAEGCNQSHGTGSCDYDSWAREGQDPWSDSPWCWDRERWYKKAEKFLAKLEKVKTKGR
jgi:hypothetical protein